METRIIAPSISIQRTPPRNMGRNDQSLFSKAINVKLSDKHCFYLENKCLSPEGIVFSGLSVDRRFLIYPDHKKIYNWLYVLSTRLKRRKIELKDEKCLLIFDYWSNGIFHWMFDALPRLEAIKEEAKELTLLLPEHFKYNYIHETLQAYSFRNIKIIATDTYLCCENLIVPEQLTTSGEMNPGNIRALRETLLNHFSPSFSGKYKYEKIYISREKAKHRKLLNEKEVAAVLAEFGFQTIYFEEHSVGEQMEIALNARYVVSPHGANLSNVIFMRPGGKIMEFRKKNDPDNNYYYSLADSVGCDYYYQNCEYIDRRKGNYFDLTVDLAELRINLEKMLRK